MRQRPQSHLLDAHASRTCQFQGIDVHRLHVARRRRLVQRFPARRRGSRQQLRGDALGLLLDGRGRVVEQRRLTVEDLVDALAQCGPLGLGNLEVAAEVEQGALADLGAGALAAHEAVGVVGLAVGMAGLGASDEHGGDGNGGGRRCQDIL